MDQDRHTALTLAHEAEGGRQGAPAADAGKVLERAEKYLAFLQGPGREPFDVRRPAPRDATGEGWGA